MTQSNIQTNMIPPSFDDLGKAARELFDKNFHFGFLKFEHKSKASNGIELTTAGTHNNDTGKVTGSLKSKYKFSDYGVTFTEQWTTNNVVTSELCQEDKLVDGLKQSIDVTFEPNTGKKCARVKNCYKRDHMHFAADLDFQTTLPLINTAAVFGHQGYMAGINLGVDSGKQALSKLDYSMGYATDDFAFTGAVTKQGTDFSASVFQRLSGRVETAVQVGWNRSNSNTRYCAVAKVGLDEKAQNFFKVKLDNAAMLGLAYSFLARDGVRLTLCSQLDARNMNAGGHKLGMSVEFES